jgi:flagellar assembly factor FliW
MTPAPAVEDIVTSTPVLNFSLGLPGFPDVRRFAISELAPDSPFSVMKCVDTELEFIVTSPAFFFPDYAPDIDDAVIMRLGIERPEQALVMVIVNVAASLADTTANLLGPIIANVDTWEAAQAVLATGDWSVKTPLNIS